ncbi:MAG: hypothetical protein JRH20_22870 [Deltaproteobacteria bacterium]|nr:hypothetical protein [Deltaproteobacteria bacterium]
MSRLVPFILLCGFLAACAASTRKQTTPEKDVNAESEKKDEEKKQSYAEAWHLICHAEKLADAPPEASREERATLVAEWITANVTNRKTRYWWIAFGGLKKTQREGFFRRDSKAAGVDHCPLAELLFPGLPQSTPSSMPGPVKTP